MVLPTSGFTASQVADLIWRYKGTQGGSGRNDLKWHRLSVATSTRFRVVAAATESASDENSSRQKLGDISLARGFRAHHGEARQKQCAPARAEAGAENWSSAASFTVQGGIQHTSGCDSRAAARAWSCSLHSCAPSRQCTVRVAQPQGPAAQGLEARPLTPP